MKAIKFDGSNQVFFGEGCHDLPAYIFDNPSHIDEQGTLIPEQRFVITCWKPSEKDIESILTGRPICLQIYGGQPPVSIYICDEKGELNGIEFDGDVRYKCKNCEHLTLESDLDEMGWCQTCLDEAEELEE